MSPGKAESVTFPAKDQAVWPWQAEPYRLWSLLEMLQFSANGFFWCGRALRSVRADCLAAAAVCVDGEPGFAVYQFIDGKARDKALSSLEAVETHCRHVGMTITADMAKDLIDTLRGGAKQSFDWLINQTDTIERLAEKELKGKLFLYIPPERAKFWPTRTDPHPFGNVVAEKFPSVAYDVENSALCLATMRSTAAVFHLMRVVEIGLSILGRVFDVSLTRTNWAPAISEIERKIREMHTDPAWKHLPDCKDQQEFYAHAATHFAIIKDAWRNHTMHARGKYTEDEAERIFESVKAFMQKLAEKLAE